MADDARQSLPDLEGPKSTNQGNLSEAFDFFELLRQLERDGRLFGQSGGPDREPARLGQHIRLGFSTQDVANYEAPEGSRPASVTVATIGLLGPEGPMPLHLTRWVLDRLSQRWFAGDDGRQTSDTSFVDFANVLQHRLIALFYRAWADATPAVQVERQVGGRILAMLEALAGIGLPGMHNLNDPQLDTVKLRQAAAMANQVDGPERLTLFISEAFGVPVRLDEFIPVWLQVPKSLQTRLGGEHAAVGIGATIGPRVFSRQNRVELRIGPIDIKEYMSLLPGGRRIEALRRAIRDVVGENLDVDVRLVLAGPEIPPPRLGTVQLGRTTWLARPYETEDADDMRLRAVVGWRPHIAEVSL